jgi:hypothetical protein
MSCPICGSQSTTRWYPPGVLVGAIPTHLQLFSLETEGEGAQGISPGKKRQVFRPQRQIGRQNLYHNMVQKHVVPSPLGGYFKHLVYHLYRSCRNRQLYL